jgi:hypothetical protein
MYENVSNAKTAGIHCGIQKVVVYITANNPLNRQQER